MRKTLYIAAILWIVFQSCQKDEKDPNFVGKADEAARPYIDNFFREASNRGVFLPVSKENITCEFWNFPERNAVTNGNIIGIDKTFWDNTTEDEKEQTIFHELGHMQFGRKHIFNRHGNGEWKSMMHGFPGIRFLGIRRLYYINELFNPGDTIAPYTDSVGVQHVINAITSQYEYKSNELAGVRLNDSGNFKIEITIHSTPADTSKLRGLIWDKKEVVKRGIGIRGNQVFIYRSNMNYDFISNQKTIPDGVNLIEIQKYNNMLSYYLNGEFIFFHEFDGYEGGDIEFTNPKYPDEKVKIIYFNQ